MWCMGMGMGLGLGLEKENEKWELGRKEKKVLGILMVMGGYLFIPPKKNK